MLSPNDKVGPYEVLAPLVQWIAFSGAALPFELKKIPLAGGAAFTLATGIPNAAPMTWSEDGNLLLGGAGIFRVPETGGQAVEIAKPDIEQGESAFTRPQLLPGRSIILASAAQEGSAGDIGFRIVALDAETGARRKVLLEAVGETHWLPTGSRPEIGHLVYGRSGSLYAAPFDAATLEVGQQALVWEGIQNLASLSPQGFSRSGTLAYPTGTGQFGGPSTLMWVDRQGAEQAVPSEVQGYGRPRLSPDGSRLVFQVFDFEQKLTTQVWVRDLRRGTTTPLTFDGSSDSATWSPDGVRLVVAHYSSGTTFGADARLAFLPADGSGPPVPLTVGIGRAVPTSVSPDGTVVIGFTGGDEAPVGTIDWVVRLQPGQPSTDSGNARPEPFLDNRFLRGEFQFSPDGKWVAYQSNESGRYEVYVVPFPGPGGKTQVSSSGGTQPRWNRNGRELFFREGDSMMAVDVQTGTAFSAGTPRMLFEKASSDYDVHPDGRRFLMLKPAVSAAGSSELHVVLNFFDELRRKVPLPE